MPYAYIQNNLVREIINMPSSDFEQYYPQSFRAHCVPCGDDTQQGWVYDGTNCVPPPAPTLADARTAKLAAIVAGADAVKSALSAKFSALEEATWPQQEVGARAILGTEGDCKNVTALLILGNPTAKAGSVALVEQLAAADNVDSAAFAARVAANADQADTLGTLSLMEQRAMESAVNAAQTIEELEAITVTYTVLNSLEG